MWTLADAIALPVVKSSLDTTDADVGDVAVKPSDPLDTTQLVPYRRSSTVDDVRRRRRCVANPSRPVRRRFPTPTLASSRGTYPPGLPAAAADRC